MNRKMKKQTRAPVSLECPGCGMDLTERVTAGYVLGEETFCCRGCAQGTGCTCKLPAMERPVNYSRPGDIGQRNPENTERDRNQNQEIDTSGRRIGRRVPTSKAPPRIPKRGDLLGDRSKRPRSQSEERPSTREQARGRSEQRGALNKTRSRTSRVDRIAKTSAKSP